MPRSETLPAVAIDFECTPLRSVPRLDIPLDASPRYRARLERMQRAVTAHGTRNAYYLTAGHCTFRFTNDEATGWVRFRFEGTVFTDESDARTSGSDLEILLDVETCDWLTQPAVEWLTRLAPCWESCGWESCADRSTVGAHAPPTIFPNRKVQAQPAHRPPSCHARGSSGTCLQVGAF